MINVAGSVSMNFGRRIWWIEVGKIIVVQLCDHQIPVEVGNRWLSLKHDLVSTPQCVLVVMPQRGPFCRPVTSSIASTGIRKIRFQQNRCRITAPPCNFLPLEFLTGMLRNFERAPMRDDGVKEGRRAKVIE